MEMIDDVLLIKSNRRMNISLRMFKIHVFCCCFFFLTTNVFYFSAVLTFI